MRFCSEVSLVKAPAFLQLVTPSYVFIRREVLSHTQMEDINVQLSRYGQPLIIILGTIGALLNEILFYFRKPLRTTSCTLYFQALSLNDLIVLWISVFPQWLENQFGISPTGADVWRCKVWMYFLYASYWLSPYFTVLACFDRFCTSSSNARLRKLATTRMASYFISATVVLIFAILSFVPMWFTVVSYFNDSFCAISDPLGSKVLVFSMLFLYCTVPPFLMIVFCTSTLVSLRQRRNRIMPVNQVRLRQRDNQLLKILLIYVTTNILCIVPFSISFFIQVYRGNTAALWVDPTVEALSILATASYASSFYVYTLGTPLYRDELHQLVKSCWKRVRHVHNTDLHLPPRRVSDV